MSDLKYLQSMFGTDIPVYYAIHLVMALGSKNARAAFIVHPAIRCSIVSGAS